MIEKYFSYHQNCNQRFSWAENWLPFRKFLLLEFLCSFISGFTSFLTVLSPAFGNGWGAWCPHIIMDRRSWLRLVFFAPFSSNARWKLNFVKNIWIERKSSFLRMWPLNLLRLKAILRWQFKVSHVLSSFFHYYAHSKISLMVQKQSYPVVRVYKNSKATT